MTAKTYDVQLYAVVRVKVPDVTVALPEDATDEQKHRAAIETAQHILEEDNVLERLFNRDAPAPGVAYTEFADDFSGALVDEQGDMEYDRTTTWDMVDNPNGKTGARDFVKVANFG